MTLTREIIKTTTHVLYLLFIKTTAVGCVYRNYSCCGYKRLCLLWMCTLNTLTWPDLTCCGIPHRRFLSLCSGRCCFTFRLWIFRLLRCTCWTIIRSSRMLCCLHVRPDIHLVKGWEINFKITTTKKEEKIITIAIIIITFIFMFSFISFYYYFKIWEEVKTIILWLPFCFSLLLLFKNFFSKSDSLWL